MKVYSMANLSPSSPRLSPRCVFTFSHNLGDRLSPPVLCYRVLCRSSSTYYIQGVCFPTQHSPMFAPLSPSFHLCSVLCRTSTMIHEMCPHTSGKVSWPAQRMIMHLIIMSLFSC